MQTNLDSVRKRMIACLLGVVAFAGWIALCEADPPATQVKPKPKVILHAGTQADADAAVAVMEKFLSLWSQRKHEEASTLVAEPMRKLFAEHMPKREIAFQSSHQAWNSACVSRRTAIQTMRQL